LFNKRIINNKYVVLDSPIEINNEDIREIENDSDEISEELLKKIQDANDKADEIIKEANQKAENIIKNAQVEAENIYEKKKKELNENYEKKYENELNNLKEYINESIENVQNQIDYFIDNTNEFSVSAIKIIIRKYLENDIFNKPQWINVILQKLRNKLSTYKKVLLKMNSKMSEKYGHIFEGMMSDSFIIKEDNSLKENEVTVETEMGVYEIDPDSYIDSIMQSLEESFYEND
jgi:flagellar assembly protein FliH